MGNLQNKINGFGKKDRFVLNIINNSALGLRSRILSP